MAATVFHVRPDAEAWIRAGHDPTLGSGVEIDLAALSGEERALLARYTRIDGQTMHVTVDSVPEPTAQGIIARLREYEAGRAEAQRQREARVREKALRTLRERRTVTLDAGLGHHYRSADWYGDVEQVGLQLATAADMQWLRELEEEEAAARAAYAAEVQRRQAEERERHVEMLREMADWAVTHGSRRAVLLVEEEHPDWFRVAVDEWIVAHTPEGWEDLRAIEPCSAHERIRPHEADILALREARALAERSPELRNPRMSWIVRYEDDEDDEEGSVVERFAATLLDLAVPALPLAADPLRPARSSATIFRRVA